MRRLGQLLCAVFAAAVLTAPEAAARCAAHKAATEAAAPAQDAPPCHALQTGGQTEPDAADPGSDGDDGCACPAFCALVHGLAPSAFALGLPLLAADEAPPTQAAAVAHDPETPTRPPRARR